MPKENNTGGIGERYSFFDTNIFLEEPLRAELGSVWTNPWQTSDPPEDTDSSALTLSSAVIDSPEHAAIMVATPSFGTQTAPRFDIEYGPIIATKADFPPYIASHQSVKLKAKSDTYKNDCIDCGFHNDARAALTLESMSSGLSGEILNMSTFDILSLFPQSANYSSTMGMELTGPVTFSTVSLSAGHTSTLDLPSACWYDTTTPLNEEDIALIAYSHAKSRIDQAMANGYVSFEYGDYVKTLEEVMINLDEKDIPNLYLLLYGMRPADLNSTKTYFFNQAIDYLKGNIDCDMEKIIKKISTGFTDFLVSAENVDASKKMHAYKDFFSLRAETNFSTSRQAEFADKLKSVNLDCRLLRWMVEKRPESELMSTNVVFRKFKEGAAKVSMENVLSNGSLNIRTYDLFKWAGHSAYAGEDINSIPDPVPSTMGFIGENDSSTRLAKIGDGEDPLGAQVKFSQLVFTEQLKIALSSYNKSFQDVVAGERPYSETVAYKISKYKKSSFSTTDQLEIVQNIINNGTEAIQNVWLANSSESEAIEYVDTQARYDEKYVFVIWAYNLVLGTRYFYSNLRTSESPKIESSSAIATIGLRDETEVFLGLTSSDSISNFEDAGWAIGETTPPDSWEDSPSEFYQFTTNESLTIDVEDDCEAAFVATTMPMAVIKEVPFFVWVGSIMDKPPVIPDVNIIPMCDSYDVLMLLNNSAGTVFTDPVSINTVEQELFEDIKTSQGLYIDLVEFGSDNPLDSYEVYRTTEKPSSYSDFSDNLLTTISTILDEASGARSDSISYKDTLESNIKYYYTFRSIDLHGHFSNPGPVFEIELVDDGESVLPSVEVIDMEEEVHRDASIPMKNVLHIVPRITQAVVNEEASNMTGDTATVVSKSSKPALGVEDVTPWGRTFKIRLISRQTKRKFDINVTFDTEYAEKKEELIIRKICDEDTASSSTASASGPTPEGIVGEDFTNASEAISSMPTYIGDYFD